MTKFRPIIFVVTALLMALAVGWLFHLYNTAQQETEQQAITSLDLGIELFRAKKYAEALEELQGSPEGVIQDWHLPYYTATAHVMLKDYQSAVPELEEALALNPQEPLILFELGVVYYKLGNLGMSKGYFTSVVEIDPTNEEAKGLMDIMANLERQQSESAQEEGPEDDNARVESH